MSNNKRDLVRFVGEILAIVSIVVSAGYYIWETPNRNRALLFEAWNLVATMEAKGISGGRPLALAQLRKNNESLAGINLGNAILNQLDLSGSDLETASLEGVNFIQANLSRTVLKNAKLKGAHFLRSCDFTEAQFERTDLRGTVLADSILIRATISRTDGDAGTSFNGADMQFSTIVNSHFPDSNFDNAILGSVKIIDGNMMNATFHRASLEKFRMVGTQASGAQFQKATGLDAVFGEGTVLDGAHFDSSTLVNPVYLRASLKNAVFFRADLKNARFLHSDLRGADFTSADLTNAMICDSKIEGAIFEKAKRPEGGLSARCNSAIPPVLLK